MRDNDSCGVQKARSPIVELKRRRHHVGRHLAERFDWMHANGGVDVLHLIDTLCMSASVRVRVRYPGTALPAENHGFHELCTLARVDRTTTVEQLTAMAIKWFHSQARGCVDESELPHMSVTASYVRASDSRTMISEVWRAESLERPQHLGLRPSYFMDAPPDTTLSELRTRCVTELVRGSSVSLRCHL